MKGVTVVEYVDRCVKFRMPDGNEADLLLSVLTAMEKWKQIHFDSKEAGGFILGYQNKATGNLTISDITSPQPNDSRSRCFCTIKDAIHFALLKKSKLKQNYYIGVWHTHPQDIPVPSSLDWNDWQEILQKDKTGSKYAIFIIIGLFEFRVWSGCFETKEIIEIFESTIRDGIYTKGNKRYEN